MTAEPRIIHVAPGGELAEIVDLSEETPVVLERNGRRFRLVREAAPDPLAGYDPERTLRAFERAAGILKGIDAEALKAEIREQRQQDSIGRPVER
jgi:hypothetical protein